jgi:hypothetical protein
MDASLKCPARGWVVWNRFSALVKSIDGDPQGIRLLIFEEADLTCFGEKVRGVPTMVTVLTCRTGFH